MRNRRLIKKIKKNLTPEFVEELLYDLGCEQVKHARGDELNYNCLNPDHLDTNPSANYNLKKNLFNCLSCGVGGDIFKLVMLARDVYFDKAVEFLAKRMKLSEDDKADSFEDLLLNLEARKRMKNRVVEKFKMYVDEEVELPYYYSSDWSKAPIRFLKYLEERRFEISDLVNNGIGYCDRGYWRNRIIVPFLQWDKIVGFTARSIYSSKEEYLKFHLDEDYFAKYKHKASTDIDRIIYGLDSDYNEKDPIFVEGSFDCIRLRSYGLNAYSTLSNKVSKHQSEMIKRLFKGDIYMMPDNDQGGELLVEKFKEYLTHSFRLRLVKYPAKDPDGLTKEEAIDAIKNAKPIYYIEPIKDEVRICTKIARHQTLED